MVRVKYLMSTPIVSISPDASIVEAAQLMRGRRVGALVVMRDGVVSGIVTERDIVYKVVAEGRSPGETRVEDVMTPAPLITIEEDASVEEAAALMVKKGVRRLLVVDGNGRPVGIITATDILLHTA